jgi:hypothetical protein
VVLFHEKGGKMNYQIKKVPSKITDDTYGCRASGARLELLKPYARRA